MRGFSLIELLLACALFVVVGGAVAALTSPLRSALERSEAGAQLEPAGRAALEALAGELREAGSGASVADLRWQLSRVTMGVQPLHDLDGDVFENPGAAVSITRTPRLGAQAVLAAPTTAGDTVLLLDTVSRCSRGAPVCGFSAGVAAILYDADHAAIGTVASADVGRVVLTRPLPAGFGVGAALAEMVTTRYGTRRAVDGSQQLVRLTTGGAEQPVLDNVVDFAVSADSPDVVQIRQITLRVRIEAGSAALRGPAGYLFQRAGTATSARRWVPDVELRCTIALRNSSEDE